MVNLIVTVQNESGSGISGIPIVCKVKNTNPIDPFAPSNYVQSMPNTDSSGISQSDNVQGYASFNCIANPNSQVSNYSSSSGTTSTTDLNNGNLTLTLKQIVSPIPTGASGSIGLVFFTLQTIGIPDIPEPDSFCTVTIRLTIYINPDISVFISDSLGIFVIGLD